MEEANENKPVEQMESEDQTIVQIRELEPGIQYSLKATAHYLNNQSVSITKTFEIPKQGTYLCFCIPLIYFVFMGLFVLIRGKGRASFRVWRGGASAPPEHNLAPPEKFTSHVK